MNQPISFASTTARFGLPLLFQGQTQKEFFVNEAHALIDALLHPSVIGIADAPPPTAAEGDCWLVSSTPTGDWAGRENCLAAYAGSTWLFAFPQAGMRVFDESAKQFRTFGTEWIAPNEPWQPEGGTTVDIEARNAFSELVAALKLAAILPQD